MYCYAPRYTVSTVYCHAFSWRALASSKRGVMFAEQDSWPTLSIESTLPTQTKDIKIDNYAQLLVT